MKLRNITAFLLTIILILNLTNYASGHSLRAWSEHYTPRKANTTYSFSIDGSFHVNGNVVNYFFDTQSMRKMTSKERRNLKNATAAGFLAWGGLIKGVETTPDKAHIRIFYDDDPTLAYWASAPRNGGDSNRHYRQGKQDHGDHDGGIRLTRLGREKPYKKLITIMAHEIGHHYGIGDLYRIKPNLQSIYSDRQLDKYTVPTRHDINALRIGLGDFTFETSGGKWMYQKSPGVWAKNEWYANRYYNSSGFMAEAFQVSYNANGGAGAPSIQTKFKGAPLKLTANTPSTAKANTLTYNFNDKIRAPRGQSVYGTFKNWNTSPTGKGKAYTSGSNFTVDSHTTLYAQWNRPIAGKLMQPELRDYTFAGWYTKRNGGTQLTSTNTISSDITVYARWTKREIYTVSYSANGGSAPPGEQIKIHGTKLTLTSSYPKRSGYKLLGWSENRKDKAPTYYKVGKRYIYSKNDSVKLHAIWGKAGDITQSGKSDINDVLAILKHLAGISRFTGIHLITADVDSNGTVDIKDALEILRHLAGMSSAITQ